jgi:hypothetical protein
MFGQAVPRDEVAVRLCQPPHAADQAIGDMHQAAFDMGMVVLETDDAGRVVQAIARTEMLLQQRRAHAGVDLMDEAPVGAHEAGLQRMALGDLPEQRLRPLLQPGRRGGRSQPIGRQPAGAQDRRGLRLAAGEQLVERDVFAALDARQQAEVGAGEQPQVVGVLAVDALEALGHDQPHAGRRFSQRAVLARAALAIAPPGHQHLDAGIAQRVARDRPLALGMQAGVREAPERGVEVHQCRQRRDLVGGDLVAQGAGLRCIQVAAGQLLAHARRIRAQEQDPAELHRPRLTAARRPPSSPAARSARARCGRTASPCRPGRR